MQNDRQCERVKQGYRITTIDSQPDGPASEESDAPQLCIEEEVIERPDAAVLSKRVGREVGVVTGQYKMMERSTTHMYRINWFTMTLALADCCKRINQESAQNLTNSS